MPLDQKKLPIDLPKGSFDNMDFSFMGKTFGIFFKIMGEAFSNTVKLMRGRH